METLLPHIYPYLTQGLCSVVIISVGLVIWCFKLITKHFDKGQDQMNGRLDVMDKKLDNMNVRLDAKIERPEFKETMSRAFSRIEEIEAQHDNFSHRLTDLEWQTGIRKPIAEIKDEATKQGE